MNKQEYLLTIFLSGSTIPDLLEAGHSLEASLGRHTDSSGITLQKPFIRDMQWSFKTKKEATTSLNKIKKVKLKKGISLEIDDE